MRGTKAKLLRKLAAQVTREGQFVVVMGNGNQSRATTGPTRYCYQLFKGRRGGMLVKKEDLYGRRT